MKISVKSILAFALVACCGMAQAASNGATSAGDTTGSFSSDKHTYTVTGLKYINPSGNDSANRNERGWYAGITIMWNKKTQRATQTYISVTDSIQSHTYGEFVAYAGWSISQGYKWNNDKAGSGVSGLGGDEGATVYIRNATWWAHITPEDAYKLNGADYTATLTIAGETFKIVVPATTYNAGLIDTSSGVQWFPAVALNGSNKVYGDLRQIAADGGVYTFVADAKALGACTVTANTTLNLGTHVLDLDNKSFTVTGGTLTIPSGVFKNGTLTANGGKIVITGGTFGFNPSAFVSDPYIVIDNQDGTYSVSKGHSFTYPDPATVTGNTLTLQCNDADCELPDNKVTLSLVASGKTYDGQPLESATLEGLSVFQKESGAKVTTPEWTTADITSAGDKTVTSTVTVGGKVYTLTTTVNIKKAAIDTVTLSPAWCYYTAAEQSVSVTSVKANGLEAKDYVTVSGEKSATAIGKHTVTVTANNANFTGTKSETWEIKNTTGAIENQEVVDDAIENDSGNAYALHPENSASLVYDATKQIWTAAVKITFPHSDYDWPKIGTPGGASYVKASTAFITYQGEQFTAQSIIGGEERAKGSGSVTKGASVISAEKKDDSYYFGVADSRTYYYLDTITWRVSITPDMIKAALDEQKTALVYTINVGSIIWATPDDSARTAEGNATGTAFQDYTITIPISESYPKLFDKYNQVYPALPYVAQIGAKKYLTLADALSAASSGQTVELFGSGEAGTFTVGKNVTVNLGGNGASGATYKLDADDSNMQAKVVSSKSENVTTVNSNLFSVSASGYTYTVVHAHVHEWSPTLAGSKLTVNCVNTATTCDVGSTYVELVVTKAGSDGVAPELAVDNKDTFLGIVNKYATIASVGSISISRLTDDGAAYTKWYVGDYRATCIVTLDGEDITLTKDFSIAKPEGGYAKNGWIVGLRDIRYDSWEESLAAASNGDTVSCKGDDRNYVTHEFSIDEKNLTLDFGGKTLTYTSGVNDMTLKNTGKGTLTFQNVIIKQPRYGVSYHINAEGNITFGGGVTVQKTANDEDNWCKITSTSGKLSVLSGIYQCKFVEDGGDVEISGGYFWYNDHCKPASAMLATNYIVRTVTINEVNFYEVVYHEHHPVYSAEGNVISATCDAQDHEYCGFGTQTAKLTANNATETTEPYAGASVACSEKWPIATPAITYWQGATPLSGAPTRFGSYTAKITVEEATASAEFTISPMKVNITVPDAEHGKVTQVLDGDTVVTSETTTYSVTHGNTITATYTANTGYEPATQTATLDCAEPGGTVTPPTFTAINYPISYTLYGGENDPQNPATYTIEQAVTLKPATKRGYTFTGWDPAGVIAKGSTGEKSFAATWTPVVYKIAYVMSNGVNHADNPTTYTIEQAVALKNPTRKGYEFTGWSPTNGIAVGSIEDRTFYATWTATVYKVEFRDAVTEDTKAEAMTYTIETPSPLALRELPAPEPNYTAKGWLTDRSDVAGQEATSELAISEDMLGNKTFYVHFVFQTPVDPKKEDAAQVVIPQVVLTNIVEDADEKTPAQINEELNEADENGITKTERYVLQLKMDDVNDVPVIQPEQTANTETVRVHVGNIDPLPANVANAEVRYSIETSTTPDFEEPTQGEQQASPIFDLPLPTGGVLYYRAKIDLVKPQ